MIISEWKLWSKMLDIGCNFVGIKTLIEESDSNSSVATCLRSGQLHIDHTTTDIEKVTRSHSCFTDVFLAIYTSFCEVFIFSGKSHCCNIIFTDVHFILLLAKNI